MYQEFILPQAVLPGGGMPIPQIDLATVYELAGAFRTSDNISVGMEKMVNAPNLRSVLAMHTTYMQASTLTQGKVTKLRQVVNSNAEMFNMNEADAVWYMRRYFDGDIAPGYYMFDHRSQPIETSSIGNYQYGFLIGTAGANAYLETTWETIYTKGMALPGIQNG
jgi:hypothetical protein